MDALTQALTTVGTWIATIFASIILWLYSFFDQQIHIPTSVPPGVVHFFASVLSVVDVVCPWQTVISVFTGLMVLWVMLWCIRVTWQGVKFGKWAIGVIGQALGKVVGVISAIIGVLAG